MGTQSTHELIIALQEMLSSKSSNRFTTEEVEILNKAIAGLENLQTLQKTLGKDVSGEIKSATRVELIKITVSILRFFLNPEMMKVISDILN